MAVPANVVVAWPSTAASIPAGWTRVTELDDRYILGAAAGANADLSTDRGNTTHTHTSPSHAPIQGAHFHVVDTSGNDATNTILAGAATGTFTPAPAHGHNAADTDEQTGVNSGIAITVDASANDLAYQTVVWIKSDGTPSTFPNGCIVFFSSDTLPSGWSRVYGDKYLKGAAAASDGGGSGGANTHTHTSPAHTHTQSAHTHADSTSGGGNAAGTRLGTGGGLAAHVVGHTHPLSFASSTITLQSVTTTINSGNHEPPYKKLNHIQSSLAMTPQNAIALWIGTNASIPASWIRFTSMDDKWSKAAAANGESNVTTGGGTQHNHTASDCLPVTNAHTHVVTDLGSTGSNLTRSDLSVGMSGRPHVHSNWTTTAETPENFTEPVTIDNCTANAALPKHRTIIFIQYTGPDVFPTPPVTVGGVWTSYDLGRFDISEPDAKILPEAAKRVAQGDLRYLPR